MAVAKCPKELCAARKWRLHDKVGILIKHLYYYMMRILVACTRRQPIASRILFEFIQLQCRMHKETCTRLTVRSITVLQSDDDSSLAALSSIDFGVRTVADCSLPTMEVPALETPIRIYMVQHVDQGDWGFPGLPDPQ